MGDLVALTPDLHRGAATVYADAFIDDPGWVAVGPARRRARWRYIYRLCLGTIRVCERWLGPSWCAVENDEVVASLACAAPGSWPPPRLWSACYMGSGPLLAGPATLKRSLRAEAIYEEHHPEYDHFLVFMLAVTPSHQRAGVGRRLLTKALEHADRDGVPAYLWTANPANPPYYRSYGFEAFAEQDVCGATNWFMERPAREP